MKHGIPDVLSPERRKKAIEEARAAGKLGSTHVPPGALTAVMDPSDTFIGSLVDAHSIGLAEYQTLSKVEK